MFKKIAITTLGIAISATILAADNNDKWEKYSWPRALTSAVVKCVADNMSIPQSPEDVPFNIFEEMASSRTLKEWREADNEGLKMSIVRETVYNLNSSGTGVNKSFYCVNYANTNKDGSARKANLDFLLKSCNDATDSRRFTYYKNKSDWDAKTTSGKILSAAGDVAGVAASTALAVVGAKTALSADIRSTTFIDHVNVGSTLAGWGLPANFGDGMIEPSTCNDMADIYEKSGFGKVDRVWLVRIDEEKK